MSFLKPPTSIMMSGDFGRMMISVSVVSWIELRFKKSKVVTFNDSFWVTKFLLGIEGKGVQNPE